MSPVNALNSFKEVVPLNELSKVITQQSPIDQKHFSWVGLLQNFDSRHTDRSSDDKDRFN